MNISEATIEQILALRDMRAEKQRRFTDEYKLPLVCFTMNIAGEVKNSPLIEFGFMCGVDLLDKMPFEIRCREINSNIAGCSAYYAMNGDAEEIKRLAVEIENCCAAARLFDIDVIDTDGKKLSRDGERKCLICSEKAAVCARSRAHGLEKIKQKTTELLKTLAAEKLSSYACEALKHEVFTTPKPGLVDTENSGAHKDMDINTFLKSIEALKEYFYMFAMCGMNEHEKDAGQIMKELRKIGIEAENAMLAAADNVNTHKGAIYSFGLLLANIGLCLMGEDSKLETLAADGAFEAFEKARINPKTHGEMLYQKSGIKGIRGEAINGFPNAKAAAAVLGKYKENLSENEARVLTLIEIMRSLEDTNVLYRGGEEALSFMKESAEKIALCSNTAEKIAKVRSMNHEFTEKNISPGGCADTLALAVFLDILKEKHYHLLKYFY